MKGEFYMKFGFSLETVNMRASEPNFKHKLSKTYWVSMFKCISAAGFEGIELPYNPSENGIMCDVCRSGMPISRLAIDSKYGSPQSFMQLLNSLGIKEITGFHINPNDTLNELVEMDDDPNKLFDEFERLADEAIETLSELGGKTLVVSATPEIGLILETFPEGGWEGLFFKNTVKMLNNIIGKAAEAGIQTAIKNEFWGLARGVGIDAYMKELDPKAFYSPDLGNLKIAGADIIGVIEKYNVRLANIRFNDTFFADEEKNFEKTDPEIPATGAQRVFCDIGDGDIDIPGIYSRLKQYGYKGYVICESRKTLNVYRALLKMRWYVDNTLAQS